MSENIKKILKHDYSYPKYEDDDLQNKIYEKREFYYNKVQEQPEPKTYNELKKYRDTMCTGSVKNLQPQQLLLSNLFTPETPFKGCVINWDVGAGKTCGAIAITENFKDQVIKYGEKIHILVPGRLLKEEWKDAIIKCTKETYLKDMSQTMGYIGEDDRKNALKLARNNFSQYYRIMSHVGFYKKVLGQKIIEHVKDNDDKVNKIYRKTAQGDYERDVATDKIESLDNTVLVIDEAHHLTGNDYGLAVKKIINNSKNLRVFLLTATPMKNLADDYIELINFLRPQNDQIIRDLVFTNAKNHTMTFKPDGRKYLGRMMRGYISYSRGASSYLYAKQVDVGKIPKDLMFTPLIECEMNPFQYKTYKEAVEDSDDTLDRKSAAVSNFTFPFYSPDTDSLIGKYGIDGLMSVRNNIKTHKVKLVQKLKEMGVVGDNLISDNDKLKTIDGDILNIMNLHLFSAKFATCLKTILSMFGTNAGLGFVYSNFVPTGIELFGQILLRNGFLEYSDSGNYSITPTTRHYLTGETFEQFEKRNDSKKEKFYPCTFISITGGTEESADQIPEEKKRVLDEVYNTIDNIQGKYIKLVLGSKVMTEGITIKHTQSIFIIDTAYHLGQIVQVIGRGIRFCVHNAVATEAQPYPEVLVHRYVVKVKGSNTLSTEGILYKKAEMKYLLVKDCERLGKENAIDCPLNYNANISKSEIEQYQDCISPLEYAALSDKKNFVQCPMSCDFQECIFQCSSKKLNLKYYDKHSNIYKKITKDKIDFSTFTDKLAKNEINLCKDKIKEMYKFKYVYNIEEILEYVKNYFEGEHYDLFEDFFCYRALDELILISENDFNNFHDPIYDKFNVPGYIIYRAKFYIFQPLNQNENVPMYYRNNFTKDLINELTLNQYFKNTLDSKIIDEFESLESDTNVIEYDFDNVLEYYDTKSEAKYVGIIDKPISQKKNIKKDLEDIFKIREQKTKYSNKKRGTGIPSLKGSVCYSSKDKKYLIKVAKAIGLKDFNTDTRINICEAIRLRMIYLEKYSTVSDNNKLTWLIIPYNHPVYPFPLNLEDRIEKIITQVNEKINVKIAIKTTDNGIFENVRDKKFKKYELKFTMKPEWNLYTNLFVKIGFKLTNNIWTMIVE